MELTYTDIDKLSDYYQEKLAQFCVMKNQVAAMAVIKTILDIVKQIKKYSLKKFGFDPVFTRLQKTDGLSKKEESPLIYTAEIPEEISIPPTSKDKGRKINQTDFDIVSYRCRYYKKGRYAVIYTPYSNFYGGLKGKPSKNEVYGVPVNEFCRYAFGNETVQRVRESSLVNLDEKKIRFVPGNHYLCGLVEPLSFFPTLISQVYSGEVKDILKGQARLADSRIWNTYIKPQTLSFFDRAPSVIS